MEAWLPQTDRVAMVTSEVGQTGRRRKAPEIKREQLLTGFSPAAPCFSEKLWLCSINWMMHMMVPVIRIPVCGSLSVSNSLRRCSCPVPKCVFPSTSGQHLTLFKTWFRYQAMQCTSDCSGDHIQPTTLFWWGIFSACCTFSSEHLSSLNKNRFSFFSLIKESGIR